LDKIDMRYTNSCLVLLMICSAVVLTSCGKKDSTTKKKSDSQVVAIVNGDEITIHQVNNQMAQMGQMDKNQAKLAAKQVLAGLVEQQLLKQQALDAKLDIDPRVQQAIEASKDQFLAQAYLEQLMQKASKPSSTDIDTFYKAHPELFENRRIFRLQELVVDVSKDKSAEAETRLKTLKDINQIVKWIKDNNYVFTVNSNVKAAEQLPTDLLTKLQVLKDGEVLQVPTGNTLNIVQIAASQIVPITRTKATPIIEQYFLNQNRTSLAKKEMIALNDKAKIEFSGEFAYMKKSDLAKPDSARQSVIRQPVAEAKADEKQNQKNDKPTTSPTAITKGLSGL
jgi:EpsD family peptidyl-prolyl cis-trans isomerase